MTIQAKRSLEEDTPIEILPIITEISPSSSLTNKALTHAVKEEQDGRVEFCFVVNDNSDRSMYEKNSC